MFFRQIIIINEDFKRIKIKKSLKILSNYFLWNRFHHNSHLDRMSSFRPDNGIIAFFTLDLETLNNSSNIKYCTFHIIRLLCLQSQSQYWISPNF